MPGFCLLVPVLYNNEVVGLFTDGQIIYQFSGFYGMNQQLVLICICIFLMSLQKLAESFVFLSHIQKRYGRTV